MITTPTHVDVHKAIFPVTPLFAYFLHTQIHENRSQLLWMPIFSTCALAALDADFEHLRTCCSGCRFSAPAHLLLSMPFLSTCALAALDADFEHLRTCCSGCVHVTLQTFEKSHARRSRSALQSRT